MPTNLLLGAESPHKPIHKTKLPALKGIILDNTTPTSRSQNTSPAVTIISTNRQQAYSAKVRGNKVKPIIICGQHSWEPETQWHTPLPVRPKNNWHPG